MLSDPRALAAVVVATWVTVEFLVRRRGTPLLADAVGSGEGADMLLLAITFPTLAVLAATIGRWSGIGPDRWRYELSPGAVAGGIVGVVAYFALLLTFAVVYVFTVGVPSVPTPAGGAETAVWVVPTLLLVNGVIVPIAEELAWRGVVQTALVDAYGPALGIAVTAGAFVAKHVVVDLGAPTFRFVSLVVIAVVLGLLRHRYGTASSTIAHLGINLLATGIAVV
ncbi:MULTISPECIES: CPBP family intramembrane glutamic endopeptidase [Halomicrobium]|uniref:Abortive infection protein n=2 Tax=Halomicrobium mukohataei TaxID=57705 RepID=C7P2H5_HALMD|nr:MULTISPECIES: CPBP family intramembrane glutamic endopeptidase [Halomicrobium]ACV49290.1 Abortive infection protein [Halomicrobium mukohataei DSM 12286]